MSGKSFQFTIEPWSLVQENKEYRTPIFNLLKRKMRLESDQADNEGNFYVLKAPEWVNVLPITSDNQVILVEQYRYGTQEPTLEIPGGMVDPGENPRDAITRELVEETGYQSDSWSSLGKVSANPAIMTNYTHLYLAENCRFTGIVESEGDLHERINVHRISVENFLTYAENGTIHHPIVLATLARYLLKARSEK